MEGGIVLYRDHVRSMTFSLSLEHHCINYVKKGYCILPLNNVQERLYLPVTGKNKRTQVTGLLTVKSSAPLESPG